MRKGFHFAPPGSSSLNSYTARLWAGSLFLTKIAKWGKVVKIFIWKLRPLLLDMAHFGSLDKKIHQNTKYSNLSA